MQLDIQSRGFPLSEVLAAYVKRRLIATLSARDQRIQSIRVRLSDINGSGGGIDKCCQLHIDLAGTSSVTARETAADIYAAIDMANERLGHCFARRLQIFHSHERRSTKYQDLPFNKHTYAA